MKIISSINKKVEVLEQREDISAMMKKVNRDVGELLKRPDISP